MRATIATEKVQSSSGHTTELSSRSGLLQVLFPVFQLRPNMRPLQERYSKCGADVVIPNRFEALL